MNNVKYDSSSSCCVLSSFSAIFLLSLLTPLFIFFSYSMCTATTVNQPGHCDERSNDPHPNESASQSVGKLSERTKECEIHHHVVCCDHCSHFCSSFSATTACAQPAQSTSQVTVTRGAMALTQNESDAAPLSVGDVKMPPVKRERGRPKGAELTVIGIQKRHCRDGPQKLHLRPPSERKGYHLPQL